MNVTAALPKCRAVSPDDLEGRLENWADALRMRWQNSVDRGLLADYGCRANRFAAKEGALSGRAVIDAADAKVIEEAVCRVHPLRFRCALTLHYVARCGPFMVWRVAHRQAGQKPQGRADPMAMLGMARALLVEALDGPAVMRNARADRLFADGCDRLFADGWWREFVQPLYPTEPR